MIEPHHLQLYVVRPALKTIKLHSAAAEALVMGTIIQESLGGMYLRQLGNGPALGICQMEPDTYRDLWRNYLLFRPKLVNPLRALVHISIENAPPLAEQMIANMGYAVAMCRLHYLRVPQSLPDVNDIPAIAYYWKRFYNTPLGRGTELEFIANFERHLSGFKWSE